MKRDGIVVVGSANMDMVVMTDQFPMPGETVFGRRFTMNPGGKGANQAVCAAKLGGRVEFIGRMGNDVFCDRLIRSMKHDGVKMKGLGVDPDDATGIAVITVDRKGQNEIVVASGSNMRVTPRDIDRHRAMFASAGIVMLQLEIPLPSVMRAAALARKHHAAVILNPAPARQLPRRLLAMVDYLTPNEGELARLAGVGVTSVASAERAARRLLKTGVGHVLVTLGARGCLSVDVSGATLYPARKVKPVDTTAAGDAFNGALAFALASGRPLANAVTFANDVAGYTVTRVGAQSSMPTMNAVKSFYRGVH